MQERHSTDIGMNRTGIAMSPIDSQALIQGSLDADPSMPGNIDQLQELRENYISEGEVVGHMPIPPSLKGMAASAMKAMTGKRESVLLDKLGERLAFERTGSRLYEALIAKVEARTSAPNVAIEHLTRIHDDEIAHFEVVRRAIKKLGADPTAMTPCADIMGVASMGLLQVVTDPRTDIMQCLDTILITELADNDGWEMLIKVADEMGHNDLANEFRQCLAQEEKHLAYIRGLLTELTMKAVHNRPS